ncbi:hypothetical protein EIO_2296 [Ketogulonicigenium vulgare Y25]|uniref:Uncharacterized protein n=1 Tax=Ketogulonicigenium vulgare (strain WSH-001) TaxID=759362 RepID=F9Y3Y4_KETVW|nr:hypothetical protein EIO_2296 [Ketogulonicigenium vulgare Y25]AEM41675.1 hypothetical protein KVU_1836 [Ketogulonicigenium vulgare WSH-001]ALJ81784.1 hypothetical protein KVH_11805 [Ketogulonicigenium vulgare]ANW35176.1 hypothetical protein KvSKV_11720 [Ketogulonicigenium vulgare]AOZ55425.1 hypothetical protein KVC_2423 [Ketogulonicigenium vulgare]
MLCWLSLANAAEVADFTYKVQGIYGIPQISNEFCQEYVATASHISITFP